MFVGVRCARALFVDQRQRSLDCRTMYLIPEELPWRPFLTTAGPIISEPSRSSEGTPLIFYRRIVTSFSLFSPYCRALTFNGSFPELKRSCSVCCWDRRRHDGSDFVGGVCTRAMKGHGEVREERDKKIIRQEQCDKQGARRRAK